MSVTSTPTAFARRVRRSGRNSLSKRMPAGPRVHSFGEHQRALASFAETARRWEVFTHTPSGARVRLSEREVKRMVKALLREHALDTDLFVLTETAMRFSGGLPTARVYELDRFGLLGLSLTDFARYAMNGYPRNPFDARANLVAGMRAHADGVKLEVEQFFDHG